MKVEPVAIDRVIPYARNPRINTHAIEKVAASIKEFGFRQPIVVDEEMVIIAGHTRLQAAHAVAGVKKVPVHVANGLTKAQIKAYRLADNLTHEDAEWDKELLAIVLGELDGLGFELDLTGFDAVELEELLVNAAIDGNMSRFFNKSKVNDLHPTMKPVELVCRALENSSKTKDIVLDSFGISGTTLIACEKLKRQA